MIAEIITVGTELLLGDIINLNANFLSKELAKLGIDVYYQITVGDNYKRLINIIKIAILRADLLIFSGGLGPTQDDITKETICSFFNKKLILNNYILKNIENFFINKKIKINKNDYKTSLQPSQSIIFNNKIGLAPGFAFFSKKFNVYVISLPGPNNELINIFKNECINYLKPLSNLSIISTYIKFFNINESFIEEKIKYILDKVKKSNITIALYQQSEQKCIMRISIKISNKLNINNLIDPIISEIKNLFGDFIYYIGDNY